MPILELADTGRALATLARLSTTTGKGQAACVRAVEVFGRPPTGVSVPLNRKTTQQGIQTLPLGALEPRQELVPVQGLESYIVKPRRDPPDVARVQMRDGRERLLIQEGHTRLGAAVLRGDTEMPVRVWEFVQTDTGGFEPVVRGRQRIYERIRDRKATGAYRSRLQTLAESFGVPFDLYGTSSSGNYGHSGRPGQVGGSGAGDGAPRGMPSASHVASWGHKDGTLTATGDETAHETPTRGKPFIVYRLGKSGEPLDDRNAGNADGVAHHIARIQDFEGPQWVSGSGDTVTAYEVVVDEDFDKYERHVGGKALDRKEGEHKHPVVGRSATPYRKEYADKVPGGKGGTTTYSFPKGGKWKAKALAEIPLDTLTKSLEDAHGGFKDPVVKHGNYGFKIRDFNDAGAILGADHIRKEFAKHKASVKKLRATFDLGGQGSGNFGHAGRPGEVGGSSSGGGKADESMPADWGGSHVTGGHEQSPEHISGSDAPDHVKHELLKQQWGDLNRELIKHMANPTSPEYIALMQQQQAITKEVHKLNLDNGDITEGIKKPGGPRDVIIIGAGPGGLNAAINGGTEGLDTLLIDGNLHVGGQVKATSRIENFGGHPAGVTGASLGSAMLEQAKRVGAEAVLGVRAVSITHDPETGMKTVTLSNGETHQARTVILGMGLAAKRPDLPGADATTVCVQDNVKLETDVKDGGHAIVVGGANSAAQAAMGAIHGGASQVTILARSGLENMSETVLDTIKSYVRAGQIKVIEGKSVSEIGTIHKDDSGKVTGVTMQNGDHVKADAVGFFIGGEAKTEWLADTGIGRTKNGLIQTNRNLETKMPGVFAVGDVRAGSEDQDSTGRVGAAHGQGQEAIRNVFKYFGRVGRAKDEAKATRERVASIKKGEAGLKERDRIVAKRKEKKSKEPPSYPRART